MKIASRPRARRGGFTLIELLLVIAIIAILLSMVAVVGNKAIGAGKRTGVISEIKQLEEATENFKSAYNVPYIPSRIVLDPSGAVYVGAQAGTLQHDSYQYLQRVFGRNLGGGLGQNGFASPVPWGVSGVLEGHQCLVFFLGGINGTEGFSTNPVNPAAAGGGRKGPFFEFDVSRFRIPQGAPTQYPGYLDRYGSNVYAYFSSYKGTGGYPRYGSSDCATLGVSPYQTAPGQYHKPNGVQIVSAGGNGQFGPGGLWSPANASSFYPTGSAGSDDLSNFYDATLGTSP